MCMNLSREKAAQAWCKPTTEHLKMDPILCEAFAVIIEEIWSKPWLGNATNAEMLRELKVRSEVHGWANYKTVEQFKPCNNPEGHYFHADGNGCLRCGATHEEAGLEIVASARLRELQVRSSINILADATKLE